MHPSVVLSTTPSIEGRRITKYRGIITGEAIMAVVGIDIDYETVGGQGSRRMVTVSGTAVVVE